MHSFAQLASVPVASHGAADVDTDAAIEKAYAIAHDILCRAVLLGPDVSANRRLLRSTATMAQCS
jgi:hypothetical protein